MQIPTEYIQGRDLQEDAIAIVAVVVCNVVILLLAKILKGVYYRQSGDMSKETEHKLSITWSRTSKNTSPENKEPNRTETECENGATNSIAPENTETYETATESEEV